MEVAHDNEKMVAHENGIVLTRTYEIVNYPNLRMLF